MKLSILIRVRIGDNCTERSGCVVSVGLIVVSNHTDSCRYQTQNRQSVLDEWVVVVL